MEREFGEAISNKRWDKKSECYVDKEGELVVHPREIVFDEVLAVIPLSGEYYSNAENDQNYKKRLDKIIRDAMTSSLRKRDEARMKKNVECTVDELKKVAEEVKKEKIEEKVVVNEQVMKEAVIEEQQVVEEDKKKEEREVKDESLEVGDGTGEEKQKKDADQMEKTEKP
ncbi:hypothetical protein Hanom_Chr05g00429751 [Helianthus anomalus]